MYVLELREKNKWFTILQHNETTSTILTTINQKKE